jgi:hypothetical protein
VMTSMIRRMFTRSMNGPIKGPNSNRGRVWIASAAPREVPLPVICRMSRAWARIWNQVPTLDSAEPRKNIR